MRAMRQAWVSASVAGPLATSAGRAVGRPVVLSARLAAPEARDR
jgi:hypothetical protein